MFESHTSQNIAEVLGTTNRPTAIVTDNARNMDVAVREAGLGLHIKCSAHTFKLATQALPPGKLLWHGLFRCFVVW